MKAKVLFVTMLFTMFAGAAQARSLMPTVWGTELQRMNLDDQLSYKHQVRNAAIKIDYAKGVAVLSLNLQITSCPEFARCFVGPIYRPLTVELPIVSRKVDECGSTVVVARADRRPVDGALEQLDIRDNRANHCPTFAAQAATQVLYRTKIVSRKDGSDMKTRSTFDGGALQPIYQ